MEHGTLPSMKLGNQVDVNQGRGNRRRCGENDLLYFKGDGSSTATADPQGTGNLPGIPPFAGSRYTTTVCNPSHGDI